MKPCNACHFEHDPRMTCGVARRLRESNLAGKQEAHPVERNPLVTTDVTACNQCAVKDAEIARLRNQIENCAPKVAPKRDRAKYMREYRSGGKPVAGFENGTPKS